MSRLRDRAGPAELIEVFSAESVPATGEVDDAPPSGQNWSRWRWLVLSAGVLLIAGILVQARGQLRSPSKLPAKLPSARTALRAPGGSAALAPVTVIDTGHRLLGVTARWELIGLGPGVVIRIQLDSGRATLTRLPAGSATAPATLLALPGRVIVRPLTDGAGYLVKDGVAATQLSGWPARPGPVVPGPGPGQVWVRTSSATQDATQLTLIGPDGRRGTSVLVPGDGYPSGDGTGHIVYTTRVANDSYLTSPGRWQIHTSGQIVADGANEVVTIERGRGRYETVVTNVRDGRRRVFASRGFVADPVLAPVAPDGRTAAVLSGDSTTTTLALLDLTSGADIGPRIAVAGDADSLAWSPDGRWLFAATRSGQIIAVDARTGAVHHLGLSLPPLTQLALRQAVS